MRKLATIFFVIALVALAGGATAQVLPGGNFNSAADLSGNWVSTGAGESHTWNGLGTDCCGNASSGSTNITNTGTGNGARGITTMACIAVTAGNMYDFGGRYKVNTLGVGTNPGVQYQVEFFSGAACTTSLGVTNSPLGDTVGSWNLLCLGTGCGVGNGSVTAPVGAIGALVRALSKVGDTSADVDRIFFGPPGTVPVELMKFTAE